MNNKIKPNLLFVCGRNKWRSPTASNIYKNDQRINVRSAGVSHKSNHQINQSDILWADLIFVFENKYKSWIFEKFRDFKIPKVINLDIPDTYEYMNPDLIDLIKNSVDFHIE